MDWLPAVAAVLIGLAFGWLAAGFQHYLYRQPEYRTAPMTGPRLLRYRIGLALACSVIGAFALRPDHYNAGPGIATLAFGWALAVLSSTDFERRIIPNRLSYPALAAALALCWVWPDRSVADCAFGALFGIGVGVALFALGALLGGALGGSGTPFGLGDVKLIILSGLLVGWPVVMTALVIGVLAAGIPSVAMMLSGRRRSVFSYGPYLAFGTLVPLLWYGNFA